MRKSHPVHWGLALLIVACLALWSDNVLADGGTLRIIPHADLKNTDPIWTTAYITRNHGYMISDTLLSLDDKLQPQPQMVDNWKVSDEMARWPAGTRGGLCGLN